MTPLEEAIDKVAGVISSVNQECNLVVCSFPTGQNCQCGMLAKSAMIPALELARETIGGDHRIQSAEDAETAICALLRALQAKGEGR